MAIASLSEPLLKRPCKSTRPRAPILPVYLLTLVPVKAPSVQNWVKPLALRRCVVIVALALAAPLLPAPVALAIPIPVDLGSTGIVHGVRQVGVTPPNVQFQGQSIVLDFSFQNGEFIRLFTGTSFFQMDALFRINNAPLPQNFAGSGYLTDNNGGALGPPVTLQAFPVTDLGNEIAVDLLLRPLSSNAVPADAYGIHLDLTLPDSPGFGFVSSPAGGIVFDGDIFGVGPGIQADIVPDIDHSLLLLGISLVGLVGMRSRLFPAA